MTSVDLTSPLSSLAPSLDSAVLEVLVRTESGLSASRIAQLARRGSRQGLTLALDRLVDHGLVLAQPANRGHLYTFNREHVLADSVVAATRSRSVLVSRLSAAVAQLTPPPVSAAVFGSLARQRAGPDSDIDLLLVLPAGHDPLQAAWQDALHDLERQVLAWSGNRLECLVLTVDALVRAAAAGEPLVQSLLDEAVVVHGRAIGELLEAEASRS